MSNYNVLFLHGWGKSVGKNARLVQEMGEQGWRVYAPALPGFVGGTKVGPDWDLYAYVGWLGRYIQASGVKRPLILVGHSFGGAIASVYAARYPGQVDRLVLINASGIRGEYNLRRWLRYQLLRVGQLIRQVPVGQTFIEWLKPVWYRWVDAQDYRQASSIMKNVLQNVLRQDIRIELRRISVPTLLIWGEHDKITPVKHAKTFQGEIPGSRLCIIPDAGHTFHYDSPAVVIDCLKDWLQNTP